MHSRFSVSSMFILIIMIMLVLKWEKVSVSVRGTMNTTRILVTPSSPFEKSKILPPEFTSCLEENSADAQTQESAVQTTPCVLKAEIPLYLSR